MFGTSSTARAHAIDRSVSWAALLVAAACGLSCAGMGASEPRPDPNEADPHGPVIVGESGASEPDETKDPGVEDPGAEDSGDPGAEDPGAGVARGEPAPTAPSGAMADLLEAHNRYRADHCAAPLAWSDDLAAAAAAWAETLRADGCGLAHERQSQYGENLAMFMPSGSAGGAQVTKGWYDEVGAYDYGDPGFSMRTGHFTQVVWRDTRAVGCAVTSCNRSDIWVCRYSPPGNYQGQYPENVLPKNCRK